VYGSVPVKSVYQDFQVTPGAIARRQVVVFSKCQGCHDGGQHGDVIVPRLSLHGGNRTEELAVCVVCHNPNQTDAAYRASGAEESVDFKRLVHGIYAGGFRKTPLVIIGFRGSVNDFSHVRFPAKLRDCVKCHIDANGQGTFELRQVSKLGSTITSSFLLNPIPGSVDVNPANDLKISPIAAACSACHDSKEVKEHMKARGAWFGVVQSVLEGKEQCAKCHGPGQYKDVRRVHEIGGSGSDDSREKEDSGRSQ
jgi:OmcA/MtrC family decaheme c-type cytochrome